MTGDINMNNHEIFNVLYPTDPNSAINLNFLNNSLSNYLPQTGGTLWGALDMLANKITSTYIPVDPSDLINKAYFDANWGGGVTYTSGNGINIDGWNAINVATDEQYSIIHPSWVPLGFFNGKLQLKLGSLDFTYFHNFDGLNGSDARFNQVLMWDASGVCTISKITTAMFLSGEGPWDSILRANVDGNVVYDYIKDANVWPTAAIAFNKINAVAWIDNSHIFPTAGILYSKLNLTNGIMDADVNTAAAIAYSKLNL